MRILEVVRSAALSPARDRTIQRYLLAQAERGRDGAGRLPVLHLGWIEGSAVSLGRFQRLRSALRAEALDASVPVLRRLTGGRTVWMSSGQLSVTLALGEPSALLPPGSPGIGPEKIINRYVRGILGGLQKCGFRAYFFGRDFLTVDRKLGGYVSFEVAPSGASLFHALIAVDAATALPRELDGYPSEGGNRADPEATTLVREAGRAVDRAALEAAILDAYARLQEAELRDRDLSPLEETLLAERESPASAQEAIGKESGEGWAYSDLQPVACGWLEAAVQVVQERFLGAVRIRGDFMAPASAVEALERDLRLVPLDWKEIGLVVDRVFGAGRNPMVGVRQLRVIPDAILEAAERLGAAGIARE